MERGSASIDADCRQLPQSTHAQPELLATVHCEKVRDCSLLFLNTHEQQSVLHQSLDIKNFKDSPNFKYSVHLEPIDTDFVITYAMVEIWYGIK